MLRVAHVSERVGACSGNVRPQAAALMHVRVLTLDWNELAALSRNPSAPNDDFRLHEDLRGDVILGSDLVYDLSVLPALAGTLAWLLRPRVEDAATYSLTESGACAASCSAACQPLPAAEATQPEDKDRPSEHTSAGQASKRACGSLISKRPVAFMASEKRNDETWQTFEALLESHGLSARRLTNAAQELACQASDRGSECPFYVDPNTLERIIIIEVSA
eukprot:2601638-Pleurochrysis_carterae.AAC.4